MKFSENMLKLYAVTDRSWTREKTLGQQVEEALGAGATMVQLREKHLDPQQFLAEAVAMKKITERFRVPLIINDDVEIAMACGAEGVHVGQGDQEAGEVRRRIGPDGILGVSAQTLPQARRAVEMGADYLGVGAVFSTATKADAVEVTLETLQAICEAVSVPVVAIGGIGRDNISLLGGTGIAGIAVVSAIFQSNDIPGAVAALRREVEAVLACRSHGQNQQG